MKEEIGERDAQYLKQTITYMIGDVMVRDRFDDVAASNILDVIVPKLTNCIAYVF